MAEFIESQTPVVCESENYFNNEKEDKLIKSFNKILKQFLKELDKSFPRIEYKKYQRIQKY